MSEPHQVSNEIILCCERCNKDPAPRVDSWTGASTRTQKPIVLFGGAVHAWECRTCGHLILTYMDVHFSLYENNISRLVEIPEVERLGELGKEILNVLQTSTPYASYINDTRVYLLKPGKEKMFL